MHDASKILMGTVRSSFKLADLVAKNLIGAGLVCRLNSDGELNLTTGSIVGLSLGEDLSKTGHTVLCRSALGAPIRLAEGFTPTIGAQVHVNETTGEARAAGEGAVGLNATYATGVLTGVDNMTSPRSTYRVACIDFEGGL